MSDSGSDSQPIINSRPLVDGEFDYTAKPSRRSFPGLPDFRDRLSCRLPFNRLNETDFQNTITSLTADKIEHDNINLIFNPFDNKHAKGDNSTCSNDGLEDLNPDYNFYTDVNNQSIENSKYFLTQDFAELIDKKCVHENQFSVLSLNIRSIRNKVDHLLNYLKSLNHTFTAIALTETWLNDDTCDIDNFNIPGYINYNLNRKSKVGGGVCIYITLL